MAAEVAAPKTKAQNSDDRIIMYRDQDKIDTFTRGVDEIADLVNDVLVSYRELDLGELSISEINKLAEGRTSITAIVQDRLVDNKPVSVGGLNLDLKQVKQMIQLPDLSEVNNAVSLLGKRVQLLRRSADYRRKPDLRDVTIIDDNAVIAPEVLKEIIDSNSSYAATNKEKEAYQLVTEAEKLLQKLHDEYGIAVITNKGALYQHGSGPYYESAPYSTKIDGQKLKRKFVEAGISNE